MQKAAKGAKKEQKAKPKATVHRYPRTNRKTATAMKALQTKQRALQVAKVMAQVGIIVYRNAQRGRRGGGVSMHMIAICSANRDI